MALSAEGRAQRAERKTDKAGRPGSRRLEGDGIGTGKLIAQSRRQSAEDMAQMALGNEQSGQSNPKRRSIN